MSFSAVQPVIFTDLDGTMLDRETYSCEKAVPAIKFVQKERIPIVFCSAKTRSEQEVYRRKLAINDPFVVENGGAIFMGQGYFPFNFEYSGTQSGYQVIELGTSYSEIRNALDRLDKSVRAVIRGFADMSDREVATETGLSLDAARLARQREYSETLVLLPSAHTGSIVQAITALGYNCSMGGRYYNVMGNNDKGLATRILIDLFRKKYGQVKTVAIGDSANDLPMLECVDVPVLVQKPDRSWEDVDLPHLYKVDAIGPEGWAKAMDEVVKKGG